MKKRALLVGYYGHQNAGDDAFFGVTAWGASRFCGVDEVVCYGHHSPRLQGIRVRRAFPLPKRLRVTERVNRRFGAWLASRVQHVIFGGGSILHTAATLREFTELVRHAGEGPHFAVGVSIGPFKDEESGGACADFLRELAFVGVRDRASLERGRALAPQARIELTFDLAPLMGMAFGEAGDGRRGERRSLGISLCNYERFTGGDTRRESERIVIVGEAIKRAAASGVIDSVTLLDFNAHSTVGDRQVHASLAAEIGGAVPVRQVPYMDDPQALLGEVGSLRGFLAMRLHGAVFAYCTDTPVTILAYHEKCREWARMANYPDSSLLDSATLTTEGVEAAIARMMAGERPEGLRPVEDAVQAAYRNWEWLDQSQSRFESESESTNPQSRSESQSAGLRTGGPPVPLP